MPVLLFLLSLFVSPPQPAPAARYRTQPEIAFSGDRYLAVWQDNRDCDDYEGQTVYAARFDRNGRILDPKGFVIRPCSAAGGYGTPQVFAEADGWSVSLSDLEKVTIVRVSPEGTLGAARSIAIPLLFDPRLTRSDRGWLIHNTLGDDATIVIDLSLKQLAGFDVPRFGTAFDDASDGSDYLAVRATFEYRIPRGALVADLIGGDGLSKRTDVVIVDGSRGVAVSSVSVVWTGSDYLVAWIESDITATAPAAERRIMTTRVSRDASSVGTARLLARATTGDALRIDTIQLRRDMTFVTWSGETSAFGAIAGCDAAPFALPRAVSFATDGASLLRIRSEDVKDGSSDIRYNELRSAIAPIGCNSLQWSSEQLASEATIAQELPAVAGDAIVWIDVQPSKLRGVRLTTDGSVAGELRFPAHVSPRSVRLATDGEHYFAAWNDGGLLKAGRVVDAASNEQPSAELLAKISYYDRGFEVTWSGSEFLAIYVGFSGELGVARFNGDGSSIFSVNPGSRHRSAGFNGLNGDVLVPVTPNGYAFAGASVPKVAWSGSEGLLVWQIGAPCGIIPECFPPRTMMMRIDAHGRALDAPHSVAVNSDGVNPDVIWTGSEYLVVWSGATVMARRFARDGQPIDTDAVSLNITPTEAPLSLAMLGNRPLLVVARRESIEGWLLDSPLQLERFLIADTTGSGRTYADATTRSTDVLVAFHHSIPGEIYGGSTRVSYAVVPH
jgi:hypothetical protein